MCGVNVCVCVWRGLLNLNCDDISLSNTTDGVEIILIHENMHQISRQSEAEELNEYMNDMVWQNVWFCCTQVHTCITRCELARPQ